MIHRVWDQAKRSNLVSHVLIATDDDRIANYCEENKLEFMMTSQSHATGSDRLAEVAEKISADVYVNIQGDEPLINPRSIDAVASRLMNSIDSGIGVATGYVEGATEAQLGDPSIVHLVPNLDGCVITFTRYPAPYPLAEEIVRNIHVGLYAFSREALILFSNLHRGPVERAESIEVMRYLEHGYKVACVLLEDHSFGVDTPEDLIAVEAILEAQA